ncbi:Hint domain-containing protein [Swingsia samuiensis]|uniref:Hedgehog/Intein (Hint) domain-containing protein n=1 Tax=Swingsia samuiensis TaxID=1293412 RepID=A0A4Y6UGD9_9PROT|nr:Hint domain-containing protein [Swingsia samuiensis]QDH16642.1 hypothetical protein E3D00_02930 [Swingsia samuiensis]
MTKTILPGPYVLQEGQTGGPYIYYYPYQNITKVSVTASIPKPNDPGFDFWALQVDFGNYYWSNPYVHGGLQVKDSPDPYRINWGGVVATDTNANGYTQNNPFDIDKLQNASPKQYLEADQLKDLKFNYNSPITYTVERAGLVTFLPGYYTTIYGRAPYYVNHIRRMWRWTFTVSSTDGSFGPIKQEVYVNASNIRSSVFWDENLKPNPDYVKSEWTNYTYESDTDSNANNIVSSSTINPDSFFAEVKSYGGQVISGQSISSGSTEIGSSGYIVNNDVSSANITVLSGGTVEDNRFSQGANVVVSGGGNAVSDKINGGTVTVLSKGQATWEHISSGGVVNINDGGRGNALTVSSGGVLNLAYNAIVDSATVIKGGVFKADPYAYIRGTYVNFGRISGGVLNGQETIYSGGRHDGAWIRGVSKDFPSEILVQKGGIISSVWVDRYGVLTVQGGGIIEGVATLALGGSAVIGPSAGGQINLYSSDSNNLTISGLTSGGVVTTQIKGFIRSGDQSQDKIELLGVKPSDVRSVSYPTADQVQLLLKSGRSIVMNIDGVRSVGYRLADSPQNGLLYETCFVRGSKIRLGSGEKAVESIEIGDEVVTLCPESQTYRTVPVIWVGRKRMVVDASRPEDQVGYPVRIVKDALGAGLPREDLVVTPEHCLYLNGGFVPARMLVNHRSIFYDRTLTDYDYFHIETAEHSILMANDVLTESYLDTGNRSTFEEQGNVVSLRSGVGSWEQDAAAPLLVEREAVEPLYREFEARAHVLGCVDHRGDDESLTTDPDLRLLTNDGTILSRKRSLNGRELFLIPQGTQSVQILSRTSRPSEVIGPFVDDRRELGVLIGAMDFFHATGTDRITGHHTAADLWGWAELESASYRWTQGAAMLPITPEDLKQGGLLSIQVIAAGPYVLEKSDTRDSLGYTIAI